ncbi:MAG: translation initiation factor IF-2 N-terminal domain-containing protein, partial [Actinomycetota bacterium]|nr:translation initiation factor IF-2 N-terminal domain-containing protein [Actinomycetota bacterium]
MPRVYEVARELGVTSKAVLEELGALGHPASSHSSSIDDATAEQVRAGIAGSSVEPAPVSGPSGNGVPQPPTASGSAGAAAVRAAAEARPRGTP